MNNITKRFLLIFDGGLARPSGDSLRQNGVALVDQAIVSGGRFLTTILVGRLGGAEQLGVYALGFSLIVLLSCVQDCLMTIPYTVFGNRLRAGGRRRLAGSVLVHSLVFGLLSAVGLAAGGLVCSRGWGPPGLASVLLILAAVIPFQLLRDLARRMAFAHFQLRFAMLLDIAVTTIQIAGLLWLAWQGRLSPAAAHAAAGLACLLVGGSWLLLRARRQFRIDWSAVAGAFQQNWTFGRWLFASHLVGMLQGFAMLWLLAFALDTEAAGAFAACFTVVHLANPFLMGMANVLEPRAARAYAGGGRSALAPILSQAALFLGLVMSCFLVFVALAGGWVLLLLYGPEYEAYGLTVTILAVAPCIGSLALAAEAGLRALERTPISFHSNVLGLVVTLSVAALLLPTWGTLGASCAIVAGVSAVTAWRVLAIIRLVTRLPAGSGQLTPTGSEQAL